MGKSKPTAIALKRVMTDLNEISRGDLNEKGIYVAYDDDDLLDIYALIIGPKDSPYEGGFYYFRVQIPYDYPFNPPKVTFLTQDSSKSTRMHPNLYANGKVCLSMLNTWSGPSWSSIQTLSSVFLTIQSIMDNFPLRNEPAYDRYKDSDSVLQDYNRAIEYYNLKVAVNYYATKTRSISNLEKFADIVEKYYVDHYEHYRSMAEKYTEKYGDRKHYYTSVYSLTTNTNYADLLKKMEATYQTLLPKVAKSSPLEESSVIGAVDDTKTQAVEESTTTTTTTTTAVPASAPTTVPDEKKETKIKLKKKAKKPSSSSTSTGIKIKPKVKTTKGKLLKPLVAGS